MRSEKLELKLVERRARALADAISGVRTVDILALPDNTFSSQWRAIRAHCGIDAPPLRHWPHPADEGALLAFLCERMAAHGETVHVPFDRPFTIRADVCDGAAFIKSLWNVHGTKDLTLFLTSPTTVLELQDLEYAVACFELMP